MPRPAAIAMHHVPRSGDERHRPEETVLHDVVQAEMETFLARERDRRLPRFVEREFRAFLECGILTHGFLRVHRDARSRPVPRLSAAP